MEDRKKERMSSEREEEVEKSELDSEETSSSTVSSDEVPYIHVELNITVSFERSFSLLYTFNTIRMFCVLIGTNCRINVRVNLIITGRTGSISLVRFFYVQNKWVN